MINGKRTEEVMLDSDLTVTMVHSNLVPKEAYTGEYFHMTDFNGRTVTFRLAQVDLTLDHNTTAQIVAVSEDFKTDVILGLDQPNLIDLLTKSKGHQVAMMAQRR